MKVSKFARLAESETPPAFDIGPCTRPLRIAIVYNRSPLPMRRADQMTVAHTMAFFHARGHAVDLYALETGGRVETAHSEWLDEHSRNVYMFRHGTFRTIVSLFRGLLQGKPIQVSMFQNPSLAKALKTRMYANEYDTVYVYYFRSAEAVKGLGRSLPSEASGSSSATYLALQLSQSLNTRRIRDNAPNWLVRLLYEIESRLVARYETRIWKEFTRSIVIGPEDLAAINAECDRLGRQRVSNSMFGAHGTDVSRFSPRTDVPVVSNSVVFSGMMRTPTNAQAIQWFVFEVWPMVREIIPSASLSIVGREPTAEVRSLASQEHGIEVTGEVEDPAVYIAAAKVCVNPMQAGGGMQNKLIEYLASGKATVATSVANEGVMAPESALAIADSPADFATEVVRLLTDEESNQMYAMAARRFVLESWTWESHFLKLEEAFLAEARPI